MKRLIFFLLISIPIASLHAQVYQTESGKAVFHSEVPMHSFTGVSENLHGLINLETKVIDFYLDLETLETGIGKRDRDMRQTLDTENYPFAEFYGELTTDFNPSDTSAQAVIAKGTFKIHGKEQEIKVEGFLQQTEEGLHLTAGWILLLKDYDIEPPSLLFMKVDQEQKIEIDALLKPAED